MKIGILSMQRIKNYGSFLQAFGLMKTIESLGHEVEFVDFKIEPCIINTNTDTQKKKTIIRKILGKIKRKMISQFKHDNGRDERDLYEYYNDYLKLLNINSEYKYRTKVDTLVIGSDEVFNCLQTNSDVGYSKELFGENNNANRLISYAASCGTTTVEGLKKYGVDKEIGELLSNFDAISVRDNNTGNVVKSLTNINPVYNLDPVLISDFDKYIPNKADLKDYIIIYAYANRITEEEQREIKKFARKYNKKLVTIGVKQDFCDIFLKASPFELLDYVKKADYIITDTFHGSVFSIKYNIPFVTIIRDSNRQKLSDLLQRFNLMDRSIDNIEELENIILNPIDFNNSNKFIEEERKKSLTYLKDNL